MIGCDLFLKNVLKCLQEIERGVICQKPTRMLNLQARETGVYDSVLDNLLIANGKFDLLKRRSSLMKKSPIYLKQ